MESKIIAIDFDATCVGQIWPELGIGPDLGAVPVLKDLVKAGHKLILWTARADRDHGLNEAIQWFRSNDISLYGIQKDPLQHEWMDSEKVHCDLIIDNLCLGIPLLVDEKLSNKPFVDWKRCRILLEEQGYL